MRLTPRLRASCVALVALALAAACGSTDPMFTNVPIEQTVFADTLHIDLSKFTKLPSGVYYRDSIAGPSTAADVVTGQTLGVRYVGYFADGARFDNNLTQPSPLSFKLGAGTVIPGWELGLIGQPAMKVGGTRRLIIPPELAYGPSGYLDIPPYAVLIFDVNVVSAQ